MCEETISEKLFEDFCKNNNIFISRIKTESKQGNRTPDYDIFIDFYKIVSEVKQFDPSKEELSKIRLNKENNCIDTYGCTPGKKVRKKIKDAMEQLKNRSNGIYPTLLVLYNNMGFTDMHIDPYSIKTAMFGLETVVMSIPNDKTKQPFINDKKFGPKRQVSETHNTTLSAIAVLIPVKSVLTLILYHNPFAKIPLNPKLINTQNTVHFKLERKTDGEFQDWEKINIDNC